jgi:molecular chaperone GrpE
MLSIWLQIRVGKMFDYCTFAINFKIMEENKDIPTENINLDTTADIDVTEVNNEPNIENEETVNKLLANIEEQKDKYLRLFAEFDNFKRRTAKEKIESMQVAGKEVIVALLDVVDDCERAEKQIQTSEDLVAIKEGTTLVFNKLKNILKSKGLKAMESIHTDFDVEKHEAITEIPAPTEDLKDKVIDEVQKGYYLNDKLIRFAKVVVGK